MLEGQANTIILWDAQLTWLPYLIYLILNFDTNYTMSWVHLLTALHFKGPGKIVLWDGYIFEFSVGHVCYKQGMIGAKLCVLLLPLHVAELKWYFHTNSLASSNMLENYSIILVWNIE